MTERLP